MYYDVQVGGWHESTHDGALMCSIEPWYLPPNHQSCPCVSLQWVHGPWTISLLYIYSILLHNMPLSNSICTHGHYAITAHWTTHPGQYKVLGPSSYCNCCNTGQNDIEDLCICCKLSVKLLFWPNSDFFWLIHVSPEGVRYMRVDVKGNALHGTRDIGAV